MNSTQIVNLLGKIFPFFIGPIIGFILAIASIIVFDKIEYARQTAAWNASCKRHWQKVIDSGEPYLIGRWENNIFVIRDPNGKIWEGK